MTKTFDQIAIERFEQRAHRRFDLCEFTLLELQKRYQQAVETYHLASRGIVGMSRADLIELILDAEVPIIKDAQVMVTASSYSLSSEEAERYVRTGIQLDEKNGGSIDILRHDGTFFCRINIFGWNTGGSVDVLPRKQDVLTALAWNNGHEIIRAKMEPGLLIAINVDHHGEDSNG